MWNPHFSLVLPVKFPFPSSPPFLPLQEMSSVQDHSTVIKDLSERQQQDPQPTQSQPLPRVAADPSDPYREPTPEAPTHSPPRFSQLLNPLPEGSEPSPPRRGLSAGTNSVTLVNHPGTIGGPVYDTTMQNTSTAPNQPAPASDRRSPVDPIRGDIPVHAQTSDDGEHARGSSVRRVPVPRPRPIFNPAQDGTGNGNGNGSRVALRASSGTDLYAPQPPQQPQMSRTVEERMRPTLEAAKKERNKYKKQGTSRSLQRMTAYMFSYLCSSSYPRLVDQWRHWAPSGRWRHHHRSCRRLEKRDSPSSPNRIQASKF